MLLPLPSQPNTISSLEFSWHLVGERNEKESKEREYAPKIALEVNHMANEMIDCSNRFESI